MCKMRELNVGDGFPRGELAATYNPERIAAINAISTVIGQFLFSKVFYEFLKHRFVHRPKPPAKIDSAKGDTTAARSSHSIGSSNIVKRAIQCGLVARCSRAGGFF